MTDPGPPPPSAAPVGTREWNHGSFWIMAVINRTPDSFYDRGATAEFDAALDAASQAWPTEPTLSTSAG